MFKARKRALPIGMIVIVFASLRAGPAQEVLTKYPIGVKFDCFTTTIAKKSTKIISLSPSATEIFYTIDTASQMLNKLNN